MQAYFDCFAGISGDMALGAFIDLGVPVTWLTEQLERIPLTGFQINAERVLRQGISARKVGVDIFDRQSSRTWADIRTMITASALPSPVKKRSLSIFGHLAEAEAEIHRSAVEDVHFHELGGIDAMVDIIGTALCISHLDIRSVTASRIALGSGLVQCQHGTLPVPSPATVSILKDVPVYGTDIGYELTTPTGAGIVAVLADDFGPMPEMIVKRIGYGAGERDHGTIPNVLRVILGYKTTDQHDEEKNHIRRESVVVVETIIDNMNPEFFGYVMEQLYRDGALDVCWIPAYMKKNRPGTLVQVVCRHDNKQLVIQRLLNETTSLGIRSYAVQRDTLFREIVEMTSSYGTVPIKSVVTVKGDVRLVPEYEACRKIAMRNNQPIRVIYETLLKEIGH